VGISRPDKDYTRQGLYKIIHLNDQSIATSGNYRNFFEKAGKTFSHIIDPKTGYPVNNYIVSASVVSKNCTFADGLATALMVMDAQAGINLVDSLENTECLIIQKNKDKFISLESQGFKALLIN
jgi:thiamine biosynthesis lipoprotein